MAQQESHKVVMVTSAVCGEGKTLLSCHLAASLARAGYRTLLVDCDLRRPSVHKVLGISACPGFSDVLRGEMDVSAAVQEGPLENLWVMPAGYAEFAAFQALAQHRSKDIFKVLKEQYDFVVVDSAPVLAVADSLLIGQCVDSVVFSVLRDVSRLPTVYHAYERLATLKVHILGAVVNGTEADYYRARYAYREPSEDIQAQPNLPFEGTETTNT
jgi:capsular exopolysaccharide synthesis family protein